MNKNLNGSPFFLILISSLILRNQLPKFILDKIFGDIHLEIQ